jgi:hypothetical protein
MKFNKNELFRLTVGKFFLFALLTLILVSQAIQANAVDRNSTSALDMLDSVITTESIMPIEKLSVGVYGDFRAVDGIEANAAKDIMQAHENAITGFDNVVAGTKDFKADLGGNSDMFKHLESSIKEVETSVTALADHFKAEVDAHKVATIDRIHANLMESYKIAQTTKEKSLKDTTNAAMGSYASYTTDALTKANAYISAAAEGLTESVRSKVANSGSITAPVIAAFMMYTKQVSKLHN